MRFMTGSFLSNMSKRAAKSLVPYRFGRGDRWLNAGCRRERAVTGDLQINSDLGPVPAPSTKKKPHRSFGPRCGKAGYRVQGSSAYRMTPEYICFKNETGATILVRRDNALLWVDRAITVTGRLTTKTRAIARTDKARTMRAA